jgi:hypothetical protein
MDTYVQDANISGLQEIAKTLLYALNVKALIGIKKKKII